DEALLKGRMILCLTQKDSNTEEPSSQDIYRVGTVCIIQRMRKLQDGRTRIILQGIAKARVIEFLAENPVFKVRINIIRELPVADFSVETEALVRTIRENLKKMESMGKQFSQEFSSLVQTINDPGRLADIIVPNLTVKIEDAQLILEEPDPIKRLKKVNEFILRENEVYQVQQKIQDRVKEEMDKSQRQYLLMEQLRAIQKELGIGGEMSDIQELRQKILHLNMPEEVKKEIEKQLNRLESMHSDSAEASVIRNYVDWVISLPWNIFTDDNIRLSDARKILDEDHYDLEKIKERILEFLSVRMIKKDHKGPILCFIGPPGVGKTSLGKSIARAMGRKFVRISLGGIRDEAEIRGHRRTYVGALPGKIIQGLKNAGSANPVFMLDEVDKIGLDYRGDPSSALLEVLDPEQNNSFVDHFIGLPFDLSKVLFITTANHPDTIPEPLKDRMEMIYLSGYTEEEKTEIAKRHIIPRQMLENGAERLNIDFRKSAITEIIRYYTREAGVRNLEREISSVIRKIIREKVEKDKYPQIVNGKIANKLLGVRKYNFDLKGEFKEAGIIHGLAWTPFGGEILTIESALMNGKPGLTLTGHLGDVMKESAHTALTFLRSTSDKLGINTETFTTREIHVHVPAGAVPKDGPSAGLAIAVSIYSLLKNKPVSTDVALTGEITIKGRVLPVGGIKEKLLAATRSGIKTVIIPDENQKDLIEIPPAILKKLTVKTVKSANEVIEFLFD
ncbi:MAG: endopeptidase La, partial [Deltaproteobacteria bacterium]|nr:endopeptidase La [Deltaproteobacteria bacterium]